MRMLWAWSLWMGLVLAGLAGLAVAATVDVPGALVPWQGFALYGAGDKLCPPSGNDPKVRVCLFPAGLTLDLDRDGAGFSLRARVFDTVAVPLPHAAGVWVARAMVGGRDVPVVAGKDGPVVWLPAGDHVIEGRLGWNREPGTLFLPAAVGLVRLSRQGSAMPVSVSPVGELRLSAGEAQAAVANTQRVQVFRLIADGVPMTVTTLFRLEISGLARSVTLSAAVPPGAIPLAVRAPVGAVWGPDGTLVLDAGPGRFDVEVVSRYSGPVTRIGPAVTPYGREIWSYKASTQLRQTRAEGPASIDPKTAAVPPGWQDLPAFAVSNGDALTITELGRGAPQGRDALTLHREMWLDFSGQGLSVRDAINGQNRSAWTLSMLSPGVLGRVVLGGQAQPVVLVDAEKAGRGVELRTATLSLTANSRYPDASIALPAGGFDREFENITTTLNLAPGWGLLTAFGPDTVRGGLLSPWSLLDLFLICLLAVATVSLRGWPAGAVLGLFLLLSWHEAEAPTVVWLFVLAGAGLLRLAGEGKRLSGNIRFRRFAVLVFGLSLLSLVLLAIPFAASQLRLAVAPQIEQSDVPGGGMAVQFAETAAPMPAAAPPATRAKTRVAPKAMRAVQAEDGAVHNAPLDFDPNAVIQTGPAMPDWHFATATLQWKGPVAKGQTMRLFFVPPAVSMLLGFARVALLGLALFLICDRDRLRRLRLPATTGLVVFLLVAGTGRICLAGDFPDRELLDTLRDRLTAPDTCFPHCLGSAGLSVRLENGRLTINSLVDAAARTAAPLPVVSEGWRPDTVRYDGSSDVALVRDGTGLFALVEPGHHEIVLSGPAPAAVSFTVTPVLTPGQVRVAAPGYRVRGLDALGGLSGPLELTRAEAGGAGARPGASVVAIPPFFDVTRSLRLGLTWEVETVVSRRSPAAVAAVVTVPLLPGEMPDTAGITVKEGMAEVAFGAGQKRLSWRSRLTPGPRLVLTAPQGHDLVETWALEAAPFYAVTYSGLPPVDIVSGGSWKPRFAPWPGETLEVGIRRPQAAPGEALTIERAELAVHQGREMRDNELSLTFRTARGARHAVRLPDGAELTRLDVSGRETLPTGKDGEVGFALPPGLTTVSIRFREAVALGAILRTPAPDLGLPAATARTRLDFPPDRWLLGVFAPTRLGPAVLYWGWLAVVIALGLGLAAIPDTPLSRWQWFVYALGLSQATPLGVVLAVGWLAAFAWRRRGTLQGALAFDAGQILLVCLTAAGLVALYATLDAGLLGLPRMQVGGGGSTATELVWTWDQVAGRLPAAMIVSAPMAVFRVLLLAWAVWLAWSLPRWLRWGFDSLLQDGGWRTVRVVPRFLQRQPREDAGKDRG